jgi:hypothetical protein
MSDLFVAVEGDGFSVSKSVAEFGSREASTALVDSSAVRGELLRNCPTDAACRVTALSASPVARFSEVRPILEALQAATSSNRIFRLVLDEGARSSTVSEFRKEEEISWAQGEVRAALESKQAELNACHGEGAQGVDALGGTLTVDFTITRLGIVFDAEVEPSRSTIVDPQIQSCVLELVTKIRFPRPAGTNSIVRHTFRF